MLDPNCCGQFHLILKMIKKKKKMFWPLFLFVCVCPVVGFVSKMGRLWSSHVSFGSSTQDGPLYLAHTYLTCVFGHKRLLCIYMSYVSRVESFPPLGQGLVTDCNTGHTISHSLGLIDGLMGFELSSLVILSLVTD